MLIDTGPLIMPIQKMYQSSSDSEIESSSRVIRLQKPQQPHAKPFVNVYYEITSSFNLLFTGMVNNNIVYGKGLKMEQASTLCPYTPKIKQAIIVGNVYVLRTIDSLGIYSDAGVCLADLSGVYTHIEALSPHLFAAVESRPDGSILKVYDTTGMCLYERHNNTDSAELFDIESPRALGCKIISSYSTVQKGVTDICISTEDVLIVLHVVTIQHNVMYYRTRAKSKPFRSPTIPADSKMKCKVESFVNELHTGLLCSFELPFNALVFDVVGVSVEGSKAPQDAVTVSSSSPGNELGDLEEHNIKIFVHDVKQSHVLSFVLNVSAVEPLKNQSKYAVDTSTMKLSAGNYRILKNGIENRLFYNEYDNSLIDFSRSKRYSFQEKPCPSVLQDSAALVLFHSNYNMNKCTLAMVSSQSVPNVQLLIETSIPARANQHTMTLDRLATGNVAIPVENLFDSTMAASKMSALSINMDSPLVAKRIEQPQTHSPADAIDVLSVFSDDAGQLLLSQGGASTPTLNQTKEAMLPFCKSDSSLREVMSPKPRHQGPSTIVSIHPQSKQGAPGQQQANVAAATFPLHVAERIEKNIQREMVAGLSCISDLLAPKAPTEAKTASKLQEIGAKVEKIGKTVDELAKKIASASKKDQRTSKADVVMKTMEELLSKDFRCRYENLSLKEDTASGNQGSDVARPLLHTLDEICAMLPRESQENIIPELPDGVSTQSLLIQYIHSIVFRETTLVTAKMLHAFEREFAFRINERIKEMIALAETRITGIVRESISGCVKKCQQMKAATEQKKANTPHQQRNTPNNDRMLQDLTARIAACEKHINQVTDRLQKLAEQPTTRAHIPQTVQVVQTTQTPQLVQFSKSVQPIQHAQPMLSVQHAQPAQSAQRPQSIQHSHHLQPVQPIHSVQPARVQAVTPESLHIQRLTIPKTTGPIQPPPPSGLPHNSVSIYPSSHAASAPVTPQQPYRADSVPIPRPNLTVDISQISSQGL